MSVSPGEIKMEREQININDLKGSITFDIILSPIMVIYSIN